MPATKTHPARTIHEDGHVTTSMVGLKNGHIYTNLTQIGVPQRYSWGTQKKKKKKEEEEEKEKKKMMMMMIMMIHSVQVDKNLT